MFRFVRFLRSPDNPTYEYGGQGFTWADLGSTNTGTNNIGTAIGRFLNDATGKTADNMFNAEEAVKAREFNSAEAQKARDWETMMSNTAYQRAAADMRAAGINPASLGGNATGSPASTPQAVSATGVAARSGSGSGVNFLGLVMQGLGMALRASIAKSALSVKEGDLDLKKFEYNSRDALRAANIADKEAATALKVQQSNAKSVESKGDKRSAFQKAYDDWQAAREKEIERLYGKKDKYENTFIQRFG